MYCRHFNAGICRSCSLLDMAADQALNAKSVRLQKLFPDAAKICDFPAEVPPEGNRIRAKLAISGSTDFPVIGFHGPNRQLIAVDDCALHHPEINRFAAEIRQLIREYKLTPFNVELNTGELKFVVLTYSPSHQQIMVQWVLRSLEAVDRIRKLAATIQQSHSIAVMSVNVQPQRAAVIQGRQEIIVSESDVLPVTMCERTLYYGPQSFIQTSYPVAQQLYQAVKDLLRSRRARRMLELYCGVGAFSLTAADELTIGLGLEISSDAIRCGNRAAELNRLPGLKFHQHDSQTPTSQQLIHGKWDVAICNPPRRGLDSEAVQLLNTVNAQTLVYSSCNPETLRRDVDAFPEYKLREIRPFNMFPMTEHMEVVAVLER
ncbi:MAG: methyltransferase [Fuerstiella sp.]